jgi:uncharacterized membrane protein
MSYRQQWQDYRIRNFLFWFFFLGFILGFVLIFFLSPLLASYKIVLVVVAILWTAALAVTGFYKTRWKCPRCQQPFQQWQPGNPAAIGNKCMHCGLPKWAENEGGK